MLRPLRAHDEYVEFVNEQLGLIPIPKARGIASVLSEESGKDGSQVILVPCGFEPFVSHPKFG